MDASLFLVARRTCTNGVSRSFYLTTYLDAEESVRQLDPVPLFFYLCNGWHFDLCYVGG